MVAMYSAAACGLTQGTGGTSATRKSASIVTPEVYTNVPLVIPETSLASAPTAIDESAHRAARQALGLARQKARYGSYVEASALFQQALLLDPFCGRAQVDLAQVLLMQGAGALSEAEARKVSDLLRSAAKSEDVDVRTLAGRLAPLVDAELIAPVAPRPARKRRTYIKN